MKINSPFSINPGQIYQSQQKKIKENKNFRTTHHDKVEISNEAKKIKELVKKTTNLPDIRQDKVNAIKEQIDSGNYKVTPEQIAKGIIENI